MRKFASMRLRISARVLVVLALACVSALIATAACSSSDDATFPSSGACTADLAGVEKIFAKSCATSQCHDSKNPAGGLDLQSPGVEGRLLALASAGCSEATVRVAPGDPDHSLLYLKVSSDTPACGGLRMPQGGKLSDAEIDQIIEEHELYEVQLKD